MKCPACGGNMEEKDFGNVKVDVCSNYHGLWFDNFEIEKLDESTEGSGKELLKALSEQFKNNKEVPMKCPSCATALHKHRYRMSNVVIDECYSCGGVFLNSGELALIRDSFKNDEKIEKELNFIYKEKVGDNPISKKEPLEKKISLLESLISFVRR